MVELRARATAVVPAARQEVSLDAAEHKERVVCSLQPTQPRDLLAAPTSQHADLPARWLCS
jgi:hypothetical protein